MFEFLKIILASNGERKFNDWKNILFVVVLVAFWAIGGILKAKSSKGRAGEDEGAERRGPGPVRGRREGPTKVRQRPSARGILRPKAEPGPERPTMRRVQRPIRMRTLEVGRRPVSRETPAAGEQDVHIELLEEPQTLETKQEIERRRGQVLAGLSQGLIFPSAGRRLGAKALLDLDDVEKLRKAILHCEILGKPVALREPFS